MYDFDCNSTSGLVVYFLRHGDAAIDPDYYACHDIMPLSSLGRRQARLAAETLASVKFERLIVSPLQRCVETAVAFVKKTGLKPEYDARLTERVFKPLYGLSYTQIGELYDFETAQTLKEGNSDTVRLEGFESLEECQARTWAAILDMIRVGIGPVLVIAHGGPHEWLIKSILEIRDWSSPKRNFTLDKCGVSIFCFPNETSFSGRVLHINLPCALRNY